MKIKTICDYNGNKHGTFKYIYLIYLLLLLPVLVSLLSRDLEIIILFLKPT